MAKKRLNKAKIGTMDIILIVIAAALTAFTVEMVVIFRETGTIPDTLVTCVFASLGGECGAMAWIQNTKRRYKDREWEKEDQVRSEKLAAERDAEAREFEFLREEDSENVDR